MGSHRIERTTEDIKRELTAIFRELKDPRVQHLRHVPELIFHATDSIEYSANISRILNSLDIKEDEEENDESV